MRVCTIWSSFRFPFGRRLENTSFNKIVVSCDKIGQVKISSFFVCERLQLKSEWAVDHINLSVNLPYQVKDHVQEILHYAELRK